MTRWGNHHLEQICKFIGITEVFHIDASGSKGTPKQVIAQGKQQVDGLMSTSFSSDFISNDRSGAA
ncbi:MAG: FMN-dependent NADH-azoreductase [Cellvibrionaceae bacterium]